LFFTLDDLSRPQLYDLPPEAFSKKRISSVGQTSDCENKEEKQNLHPGKSNSHIKL